MKTADLDQALHNTDGNSLLKLIDEGAAVGRAILDRAVQLYREGTLPARCGFLIDVVLGSTP